ncbi:MAG: carbon starvation protein A, partial [Planctomycetes bacterium]|nr:carbon starvation protein A [Planctomycetota bacterium]
MSTLIVALASFVGFIFAYHTYGRWLSRKIFGLDPARAVPAETLADGQDFVSTRREVVFGHHFTSIAGTGPIVGPAIAVFWGWLPALLWVVFGSIFIGAVHDFGSLAVSLRNEGRSVGDVAGRVIGPVGRLLFLVVLLLELMIVLAVFGLVIAVIFANYPESVLSVWIEIPLAVAIGFWVYKKRGGLLVPSLIALAVMYGMIWVGTHVPVDLGRILGIGLSTNSYYNVVVVWTVILFIYCFFASVLPVWSLLQPRDFINSHELLLAMGLLVVGMIVAAAAGQADLVGSAPAIVPASDLPADAPKMLPFLFITVACGAVSGFHCLVSSGTSAKQLARETDAQAVGYGAMLLEGALAVIVILACCSGVGMKAFDRQQNGQGAGYSYVAAVDKDTGGPLVGSSAWRHKYNPDTGSGGGWVSNSKLDRTVGAFIEGGANFLTALGIPLKLAVGILAVLAASFAGTTIDTATRLQRYVVQELGEAIRVKPLTNRYVATTVAVLGGLSIAVFAGSKPGSGGMLLWPMFGATNQLLAGLAFMVIGFYLLRQRKPVWFLVAPAVLMLVLPGWAMVLEMRKWWGDANYLLLAFGGLVELLAVGMVVTAVVAWWRLR